MTYDTIRKDILETLTLYVEHGVPTGGFLEAVLCNDLMGAICRADDYNRETLWEICSYVHNEIPAACHGSPEKVHAWFMRFRVEAEASSK